MNPRHQYPLPFSRISSAIHVTVSPALDGPLDEEPGQGSGEPVFADDFAIRVDLPGGTRSFTIPDGWLHAGAEYTLDVRVVDEDGHLGTRDYRFFTAS